MTTDLMVALELLEERLRDVLLDPAVDRAPALESIQGEARAMLVAASERQAGALVAQAIRLFTLAWLFGPGRHSGRGRAAARMRHAARIIDGLTSEDVLVRQWLELERAKCAALRGGILDLVYEDRSLRGMAAAHRHYLRSAGCFVALGMLGDPARQYASAGANSFRIGRLGQIECLERAASEYDVALRCRDASITVSERAAWRLFALSARAEIFATAGRGDFDALARAFTDALAEADLHCSEKVQAAGRLNLAGLLSESRHYRWQQDLERALELLDQALALAVAELEPSILLARSAIHSQRPGGALTTNVEHAIADGELALAGLLEAGAKGEAARACHNLAEAFALRVLGAREDNLLRARHFAGKGGALARAVRNRSLRLQLLATRGRVETFHLGPGEGGRRSIAVRALRAALGDTARSAVAIAIDQLALTQALLTGEDVIAAGDLLEADRLAESAAGIFRARRMADAERRALLVRGDVAARQRRWEETWRLAEAALSLGADMLRPEERQFSVTLGRIIGTGGDAYDLAALALLRCGRTAEAFERAASGRGRALRHALGDPAQPLTALLPAGRVILVPLVTAWGSALLLADGSGEAVAWRAIDLPDNFLVSLRGRVFGGEGVQGIATAMEADAVSAVASSTGAIFDWAAGELGLRVSAELDARRVREILVLPDGIASPIPWQAALSARIEAEIFQSPALAGRTMSVSERREGSLLLISDPTASLQGASAEVAALRAAYAGVEAVTLGKGSATVQAIREAADTACHIHFAGHARFDPYDGTRSGLLVDGGALLTIDEISSWHLAGRPVVTLAGCESGVADFAERGHEAIGLASAFLSAGASAVIGALWKVSDAATALYFLRLHRHLREAMTPAAATAAAARDLRGMDTDTARRELDGLRIGAAALLAAARRSRTPGRPFDHPYYWAVFACFALPGEGGGTPGQ